MLNMLYGTSTDSVARKAAAQAQADVTAALSTMAGLGTLAQQDVITSSQILDPENLPSGGGEGVDTDENAITAVAGFTYRAFSAAAGAFAYVADKDPARGTDYIENVPLDCPAGTSEPDTVLGLPATRNYGQATFTGPVLLNGPELAGFTAGSVLTLAFAVKLYGVTPDKLRVRIFDAGDDDYFGLDFATATVEDAGTYGNTEIGSAVGEAGNEISGDLGTREYIVSLRMPVLTTIAGNIEIRVVAHNTSSGNADNDYAVAPIALYVDEAYDYDATDGTEKFELSTAGGAGALLTMTTKANQVASIDGDNATLVLPAAPAAGTVRAMALRVDIVNGGSLTLPSSDVTIYGDAGPFDAEVVLAVRQYDDGTADIAVRGT